MDTLELCGIRFAPVCPFYCWAGTECTREVKYANNRAKYTQKQSKICTDALSREMPHMSCPTGAPVLFLLENIFALRFITQVYFVCVLLPLRKQL